MYGKKKKKNNNDVTMVLTVLWINYFAMFFTQLLNSTVPIFLINYVKAMIIYNIIKYICAFFGINNDLIFHISYYYISINILSQ